MKETEGGNSKRKDNDGLHKRRGIWHYKLNIAGRWREFSTRTTSYQEARRIRQQALDNQREGRLPTDMAKWPFDKAATEWLGAREKTVAHQTYLTDKGRLKPLLNAFAGKRLEEITNNGGSTIRAYQLMRAGQVSARTVNLELKVARMILRAAKLWARVADDCRPLRENKRGPGRALTSEQEKELWETASKNRDWMVAYCAALIAANTTARGCEIKGLRLADIDLVGRTMSIRRATTKTDAGCRVVPLNTSAAWGLARLVERAAMLGAIRPEHYLLPAYRFRHTREATAGSGYDPTQPMISWRSAWRKLTKAAGLTGLRFHDLRHHCITRLAEAGVPEQTLMAIAGHVSREMLEHYSHIRMQSKRQAVAALDSPPSFGVEAKVLAVN